MNNPRMLLSGFLLCQSHSLASDLSSINVDTAQGMGIYPELKCGLRSYQYSAGRSKVFDVNFPSVKVGILGEYQAAFAQVYYERSLGDGDGNVEAEWDGRLGTSSLGNLGPAVDYTRSDMAALGGTRFSPMQPWGENIEVGIFAGYKRGTSEINFKEYYNIQQQQTLKYEYNIDTKGPFLGLGFAIEVDQFGLFGTRAAYSWLDVTVEEKIRNMEEYRNTNYSGTGKGLSLGLAWIGSLTQHLQYILELDWHDYSYNELTSHSNSLTDIDETQTSWRVGVTYMIR
jgi:hypothetical protein